MGVPDKYNCMPIKTLKDHVMQCSKMEVGTIFKKAVRCKIHQGKATHLMISQLVLDCTITQVNKAAYFDNV